MPKKFQSGENLHPYDRPHFGGVLPQPDRRDPRFQYTRQGVRNLDPQKPKPAKMNDGETQARIASALGVPLISAAREVAERPALVTAEPPPKKRRVKKAS